MMIAIWGPPRSGKTTLAIDLAYAFSQHGKSALIISAEPYSELTARMGIRISHQNSLEQAFENMGTLKQAVLKVDELLFVLAYPWDHDAFGDEPGEAECKELYRQAVPLFDVILVDCPTVSTEMLATWGLCLANATILLSGSNERSVMWYRAFRRAVEALRNPLLICMEVEDDYDYYSLCKVLERNADLALPHVQEARNLERMQKPLYGSGGRSGRAYTDMLNRLCQRMEGQP